MNIKSRPKFYLVYGNHGNSPVALEDYFDYLSRVAQGLGIDLLCSFNPQPGAVNILVEYFEEDFIAKIKKCKAAPGTSFIVVVTEFVTGQTFNLFEDKDVSVEVIKVPKPGLSTAPRRHLKNILSVFFPPRLRDFLVKRYPHRYAKIKNAYMGRFAPPEVTYYDDKDYWVRRLRGLEAVVQHSDHVWCVSPHQMPGYLQHFPEKKVDLLPIVSWSPEPINTLQGAFEKDIDFLFTGSVTPYRRTIFNALSKKGYKVVIGSAVWPKQIRENYVARAKVCLHIKQKPEWKYPSIMRYHYLITSAAPTIAEFSFEHCMQEQFLTMTTGNNFLAECEARLHATDLSHKGLVACQEYYQHSALGRIQTKALFENCYRPKASEPVIADALESVRASN